MRRHLSQPIEAACWPDSLTQVPLSRENTAAVHQLLALGSTLGGGQVADFETWMDSFDSDPEFDRQLCFVVTDDQGVIAVAQCWTSAFIRNLVVHPRAQGQGVGHRLLALVFNAFAERGEGQVDLKVMECNLKARRLYEQSDMQYVQRCELEPR